MQLINDLSVTSQHLILLLLLHKYKKVKNFADRNGEFDDLPIVNCLGVGHPHAPHCNEMEITNEKQERATLT